MFKEYILKGASGHSSRRIGAVKKRILEEIQDPCAVLRNCGIRIKKSVPHKQGYEISLFEDPLSLPLDKMLRGFRFTVRDSKIYVEFKE